MRSEQEQLTPRIMVVDDEPAVLRALERLFRRRPLWKAEFVEHPLLALQRMREVSYDLFLIDYKMPGLNGLELLEHCEEQQPAAVRLLITGRTDLTGLIAAVESHDIHRLLLKPWEDFELLDTLDSALRYRRVITENRRLTARLEAEAEARRRHEESLRDLARLHPDLARINMSPTGTVILSEAEVEASLEHPGEGGQGKADLLGGDRLVRSRTGS